MPRYMFLIKADAMAEGSGQPPPPQIFEDMTKYNEELNAAGVLLAADGFLPTSVDSFRVTYDSSGPSGVVKGPFDVAAEAHVCGFWIVRTKDAEEALAWAKKIPFQGGELVVRRIAELEDMGDAVCQDVKERERKMAEDVAKRVKGEAA